MPGDDDDEVGENQGGRTGAYEVRVTIFVLGTSSVAIGRGGERAASGDSRDLRLFIYFFAYNYITVCAWLPLRQPCPGF